VRVLLVDDEERFVSVLTKRLRLRGIDAEFALSGDAALAAARERRFDVALLDVKMPGMGGIELRRRLEALSPGMKFLFVTGHGSRDDYEAGTTEGAIYVAKPIEIDDLIEVIGRYGPGDGEREEDREDD
jgi:DNA-binding NtrC family response regulator